ncbi:MAG: respiratory nitrate reductase subunit gamma [Anaerosomatales bacterium]|nr:respiratory nitrate reductase subunit gamma [Anaerosomatales bacterium]MDT8434604.1 respiratory nitrate reductase subunit gamma [Anaerosomatales bacterium]
MELYLEITSIWGVYLGIAVFIVGMAWRAYQWATTPRSPVALGMFPKPATGAGRFTKMLKDTFIAPQSAKIEPVMWAFAFLFHIAALAAFVGHLRLVQEFTPLKDMLGTQGMNEFAAWAGGIAGTIMMVAVIFWILRRTFGPYKQLSVPEDYLLLFLLLGVIIMGNHMRFFGIVHSETYMEWFRSLMVFKPEIPAEILATTTGWSLGTHMLFTTLFLIYFPFSKLTHAMGAFAANMTRSE